MTGKTVQILLLTALVGVFLAGGAPPCPAAEFGEVWDKAYDKLEKTLELIDRQEELPEKKLFGTDREEGAREIEEHLNEVISILVDSPTNTYRLRVRNARERIAELRSEIAELQRERISAPAESKIPFRQTKEKIDEEIADKRAYIEANREEIEKTQKQLADKLREAGLDATDEQIKGLLMSISGNDIVKIYAAFENIRNVTEQLMQLMKENRDNIDVARKYYGIYAVLLRTAVTMQENFLQKVDDSYLPRLDSIISEARGIIGDARQRISSGDYTTGQREILRDNIASNELTIKVARLYKQYLHRQYDQVAQRRDALQRQVDVAMNTYRTVTLSSNLISLMESSDKHISLLTKLEIPSMVSFDNQSMQEEFQRLTVRLER